MASDAVLLQLAELARSTTFAGERRAAIRALISAASGEQIARAKAPLSAALLAAYASGGRPAEYPPSNFLRIAELACARDQRAADSLAIAAAGVVRASCEGLWIDWIDWSTDAAERDGSNHPLLVRT